jgi:hypothetical protein
MNNPIIPPYIAKNFKILPLGEDTETIQVKYVNTLSEKNIEDLQFILKKRLELKTQIQEPEFLRDYQAMFDDVHVPVTKSSTKKLNKKDVPEKAKSVKKIIPKESPVSTPINEDQSIPDLHKPLPKNLQYSNEAQQNNTAIGLSDFIKEIPTKMLEKELKTRYLAEPLDANINFTINNEVQLKLNQRKWPLGNYKVKIIFESEIEEQTK